jgi:hypothetical protein
LAEAASGLNASLVHGAWIRHLGRSCRAGSQCQYRQEPGNAGGEVDESHSGIIPGNSPARAASCHRLFHTRDHGWLDVAPCHKGLICHPGAEAASMLNDQDRKSSRREAYQQMRGCCSQKKRPQRGEQLRPSSWGRVEVLGSRHAGLIRRETCSSTTAPSWRGFPIG